ncbi:MAG TPA: hypothetical protein VFZ85_00900 [Jiangellaceae bacterium]
MFDLTSMILAGKATERHQMSARPTAPTGPGPQPRRPRAGTGRVRLATMLRRLADRVEPRAVQPCQTAS